MFDPTAMQSKPPQNTARFFPEVPAKEAPAPELLATAKAIVETFTSLMTELHIAQRPSPYAVQAGINYIAETLLPHNEDWDTHLLAAGIYSELMQILELNSTQSDTLEKAYKQICTRNIKEPNNLFFTVIQCLLHDYTCPKNIFSILQQPNRIQFLTLSSFVEHRAEDSCNDRAIQTLSNMLVHPECKLRMLYLQNTLRIGTSIVNLSMALQNHKCNLSTIYFGDNALNNDSLKSLARALQNPNCKLTSVYFSTHDYTNSQILDTKEQQNLQQLYGNNFTPEGLWTLAKAVLSQGCRTKIYMGSKSKQDEFDGYLREIELKESTYQFRSLSKF
ncbi:MAG: hypothetical protein WCW01_05320 [Gammaproteobacteria bacterium]